MKRCATLLCVLAASVWALVAPGCTSSPSLTVSGSGLTAQASGSVGATASATAQLARPTSVSVFPSNVTVNVPAPAGFNGPRAASSYQLTGTVYFSDGTVTSDVLWECSDPSTLTITQSGLVSSVLPSKTGVVTITGHARVNPALTATATVSVVDLGPDSLPSPPPPAKPLSVLVFPQALALNTPPEATAPVAVRFPYQQKLVGTVFYSDGSFTGDVLWSSSNPSLVTVDPASGLVSAVMPHATGTVTISATSRVSNALTGTAQVTVQDLGPNPVAVATPSPVPQSVLVFPGKATINTPPEATQSAAGRYPSTLQFTGTVFMTDGSFTNDVLWSASPSTFVSISPAGLATALIPHATGSVTITAQALRALNISATASLTVADLGPANPNPAPISQASISVFPLTASINTPYDGSTGEPAANLPTSIKLQAWITNTDGSTSSDVVWYSTNPAIVAVDAAGNASSVAIDTVGTVPVVVQSRLNPGLTATVSVTVVNNGKVNVDVQ